MTKPQRIASSFPIVDKDGAFFPHLYIADINRLVEYIDDLPDSDEEFAGLLQRILDWITAESVAVANNVKIIAERIVEDNVVVVKNIETGIVGEGDNIVLALYDCAVNMMDMFNTLDNMDKEEVDTIDWASGVLSWANYFPQGDYDDDE